ncbi:hypothetical protein PHET_05945 [Paragonimus heterotremus]|uniref:Uncharacterized protein n=1 Tax=Paragonimus heterotremus TaxID=100268 RepID=A0A8J4WR64_9TREM|nr:hypothetical protein PHET_05945 [Paragonimus heterotremus]
MERMQWDSSVTTTKCSQQIKIGISVPGIDERATPFYSRGISISPPICKPSEQQNLRNRLTKPGGSVTIRRRSWHPNVADYDAERDTDTADIYLCSDYPGTRLSPGQTRPKPIGKSIRAFALTPPTKAISILIGGTKSNAVGSRDDIRAARDSSKHALVPTPQRVGASVLYDLGIRVDRPTVAVQSVRVCGPSAAPSSTVVTARSALAQPFQHPVALSHTPLTIGVSDTGSVLVSRGTNGAIVNSRTVSCPRPHNNTVSRRNSFTTSRPPLPRSNTEPNSVGSRQTRVRISTSKGCGVVVATSSASGLKFVTDPYSHVESNSAKHSLRPSGSCGNLLSHTIELDFRPNGHSVIRATNRSFTRSIVRTTSLVDRREFDNPPSDYFVRKPTGDMPNAPSSGGLGAAKASCSPTSHETRPVIRLPYLNENMSDAQTSPHSNAPCNIFGLSPVIVSSSGKPASGPGNIKDKPARLSNRTTNPGQYFRIQLPCTRASSRSKGFSVTDSLKLYEDQIFGQCDPSQRPQSWCIDFGSSVDEIALIDDSHSSSPASTVSSSYSSSSSSDASQSPSFYRNCQTRPVQTEQSCPTPPPQPRVFRCPVKLSSSKEPAVQPNEDAATPTDNEPAPIGLGDVNSESHSSLLPPPSPRASANVKVLTTLNGIADGSGLTGSVDSGISQPIRSSSPAAQYSSISGNSSFSSGFETVRPTHLPNATACPASDLPASISLAWEPTRSARDGDCSGGEKLCGMTPCSNSSSAPTLSYHNNQREHSPPSFHDDAWLPDSPALAPSTHSSDPSDKQTSHPTSPDASSLLLPPPAPWNVIEYVDGTPSESDDHVRYSLCCRLAEPETADFDREPPPPSSFSDGLNERVAKPRSSVTEDGGGMVGTLDSDVFTYTTPLTPEFPKPVDGDSGSDMVSSIVDEGTYAFSTLDSEYMAWMRLSVMDVVKSENDLYPLTTETLDSTPRSQVHRWVDLFNSNPLGLRLNFVDDSCRLAGTLRIHINLIKPVKMSLRQTMDMLPESAFKQTDHEHASRSESSTDHENGAQHALPPPARLVSFFLPRGTSKVVYILRYINRLSYTCQTIV